MKAKVSNNNRENDGTHFKIKKEISKAKARLNKKQKKKSISKLIFPVIDFPNSSDASAEDEQHVETNPGYVRSSNSSSKHVLKIDNNQSDEAIIHKGKEQKLKKVKKLKPDVKDKKKRKNKKKILKKREVTPIITEEFSDVNDAKCQTPRVIKRHKRDYFSKNGSQYSSCRSLIDTLKNPDIANFSYKSFCSLFKENDSLRYENNLIAMIPSKHLNPVKHTEQSTNKPKVNVLDVKVLHFNNNGNQEYNQNGESIQNFNDDCSIEMSNHASSSNDEEEKIWKPIIETNNEIDIIRLVDQSFLLILQPGCERYFFGLCTMQILYGEVFILGANLNVNSGQHNIYSPRGSSLLSIRNKFTTCLKKELIDLRNFIENLTLKDEITKFKYNTNCAIILCKELKEFPINFIENHIAQRIFPPINQETSIRMDFDLKENDWNRMSLHETWEDIFDAVNLTKNQKIIIAGGKGVGKSTFLRYCINKLLMNFDKVRVIDLDSGQSEFTPPGCVSIVTVDQFIIGPNYTHQQTPDRMILSHINIGHNPNKYLTCIYNLLNFLKFSTPQITIVNLPGYTQGAGLEITLNTINEIKPTLLIQINSTIQLYKNYKFDLNVSNVTQHLAENNMLKKHLGGTNVINNLDHKFILLNSMAEHSGDAWRFEARVSREINIMSYMGKMMKSSFQNLTSSYLRMHTMKISSFTITDFEGTKISPLAINANLVALCNPSFVNTDVFICYGYGFVRGLNIEEDSLILLTPESAATLETVQHLVLSSVTCPPSLLMNIINFGNNNHPYVCTNDNSNSLSNFSKRSYNPPCGKKYF